VKRLTLSLLTLAILGSAGMAQAQQRTTGKTNPAPPSSIGLIDMAHVFQNYEKFKDMREQLQSKIAESDAQAKKMVESIQNLQRDLVQAKKEYNDGSPQCVALEKEILEANGKFQAFKKSTQLKLAREESEMLKVVYSDVSHMVGQYAEWAEFTMVLRFNRKGISTDMQPQEAIQLMNKNVIYHRTKSDITDRVLAQLNKQYGGKTRTPARNASSRRTVTE